MNQPNTNQTDLFLLEVKLQKIPGVFDQRFAHLPYSISLSSPLPTGLQTERGTQHSSNQVKPGAPHSFHIDLVSFQCGLSVWEEEYEKQREEGRMEAGTDLRFLCSGGKNFFVTRNSKKNYLNLIKYKLILDNIVYQYY